MTVTYTSRVSTSNVVSNFLGLLVRLVLKVFFFP